MTFIGVMIMAYATTMLYILAAVALVLSPSGTHVQLGSSGTLNLTDDARFITVDNEVVAALDVPSGLYEYEVNVIHEPVSVLQILICQPGGCPSANITLTEVTGNDYRFRLDLAVPGTCPSPASIYIGTAEITEDIMEAGLINVDGRSVNGSCILEIHSLSLTVSTSSWLSISMHWNDTFAFTYVGGPISSVPTTSPTPGYPASLSGREERNESLPPPAAIGGDVYTPDKIRSIGLLLRDTAVALAVVSLGLAVVSEVVTRR